MQGEKKYLDRNSLKGKERNLTETLLCNIFFSLLKCAYYKTCTLRNHIWQKGNRREPTALSTKLNIIISPQFNYIL